MSEEVAERERHPKEAVSGVDAVCKLSVLHMLTVSASGVKEIMLHFVSPRQIESAAFARVRADWKRDEVICFWLVLLVLAHARFVSPAYRSPSDACPMK